MALHMNVKEQKWNFAKRLVEVGADVNELDFNGLSVLHVIATQKINDGRDDCTAFINLLLIKGADVTARSPKGESVFHLAAKHDNWEIIEQILTQSTDGIEHVGEPDSEGLTMLQRLAIKKSRGGRNISLLQLLLDNGAQYDILCPSGDNAMHMAVKHGNWCILHVLLCHHIGPQSISTTNKQWLSPCITFNQFVERSSVNIDTKDASGNTVLHLCAKAEAWNHVNTLLKCGADASLTDDEGDTVLNRLFHATNVYTEEINEFFDTIIQVVTRNKNVIFFDMLLDHLDDVNMRDSEGLTILHRVVQCTSLGSLDFVRTLIKWKADIEISDPNGDTALHLAAQCGNWDIVRELLENGASASHGMSLARLMVRRGLDTNTKDQSSIIALPTELNETNRKVIQFHLESGADKALQLKKRKSFFHELAKDTSVDAQTARSVTQHLLRLGFDLNERETQRDTPFSLAAYHGNWIILQVFLDHGADACIPDAEGKSVLTGVLDHEESLASTFVKFLVQLGVSTHQPALTNGVSTRSPSQRAFEKKYVRAFEMLVESGASSNKEIFDLNTRYQKELYPRHKTTTQTQMLDILKHAASQPRSLKSLSRLTVSHALGYRPRRMDRVNSLPLPASLNNYILFSDLL